MPNVAKDMVCAIDGRRMVGDALIMRMGRWVLLILVGMVCSAQSLYSDETGWELKKDQDGIRVYTRKVEGSPIREFLAEMTIDAPIETVISIYDDETRLTEWFYQCSEAQVLEVKPGDERILYFVLSMPWPVSNRDSVYSRIKSMEPDGTIVFRLAALPDAYPGQPGLVRVPYLNTEWRFKPLDAARTEISFRQHSDAGGILPKMLVNKLVVNIPFNSLRNLRDLVLANTIPTKDVKT